MRILVVTKSCDSSGLVNRFIKEGHDIRVYHDEPELKGSLEGIAKKVSSIEAGLKENPHFVLFDMVGMGEKADQLRARGWNVFGASKLADEIELKREKGLEFAKKAGIKVPETQEFNRIEEAIAYVKANPDHTVVKVDGNLSAASSFVAKDVSEMVEWLNFLKESGGINGAKFILQQKLKGIEVSTECWFSKGKPVLPYNQTLELKKFFPGDLGPATGCMFSAVYPLSGQMPKFIDKTLKKIFPQIEKSGWSGPLDINCIVDEKTREPYFLEWTARLGYSAIYALAAMLDTNLGEFFYAIAKGTANRVPMAHSWGTALRLVVPPYPNEYPASKVERIIYDETRGQPIKFKEDKNLWLCDVIQDDRGRIVTGGIDCIVAECTGQGSTLIEAWNKSKKIFEAVEVPNKMGRFTDGMDRAYKDSMRLRSWGYDVPRPTRELDSITK